MRNSVSPRFLTSPDRLQYEVGEHRGWEVAPKEILVIGEATSESWADDYFLCFVTSRDGLWMQGSFYADGSNETLSWLRQKFDARFEWQLCNSVDYRSRVMWPTQICDLPLFTYDEPQPKSLLGRTLRNFGIGPFHYIQSLSPQVLAFLQEGRDIHANSA